MQSVRKAFYGKINAAYFIKEDIADMDEASGSILPFVGAPRTAKNSIGQSIAKVPGRKYVRVSLIKSLFPEKAEPFEKNDLHIHMPAGSIPKDGSLPEITLTTAIVSLVTGQRVNSEYAMTGKVSQPGQADADWRIYPIKSVI